MKDRTKRDMQRGLRYSSIAGILLATIACAASHHPAAIAPRIIDLTDLTAVSIDASRMAALQHDLAALNHSHLDAEAKRLAETALRAATFLAGEYRVIRPPLLHNLFVHMGLRDRGLCYHWTEDLMAYLQALDVANYALHWGVARQGSDLREHNTVVVTPSGHSFENGLVLDPWRHAGRLYWIVVKNDSYAWCELPPSEWQDD